MTYPNLYILLVAPPGVGKSEAIRRTEMFWWATKQLKIAPTAVTKAALVDRLAEAKRRVILPDNTMMEYHSLQVPVGELGVMIHAHDLEFLSVLNDIYDAPAKFRESRRHAKTEIDITNPQFNILAGTQPGFMASLLPEEAWTMGFTSRFVMVYCGEAVDIDLFGTSAESEELKLELTKDLGNMTKLYGPVTFTEEAKVELQAWARTGLEPIPLHSKLQHYNSRRLRTMLKLCTIAAASQGELCVDSTALGRAKNWLLYAESLMPSIFREMLGKSDSQTIQEMHFFMWQVWVKDKKPLHESRLINFLQTKVPADKIDRIMQIAERSGIIERSAGTQLYTPRPTHKHGME